MPRKSLRTHENSVLIGLLKEARLKSGLTQAALAEAIGHSQAYISDIESGEKRLDLVQLRDYCEACGVSLVALVKRFESAIK
ncbi:helix-turn-helix transcriptional regulator [Lysobacter enzymogenes]|nr:helix-turn-helix transcriptional regulator [Lysobacter enzymogenes]QCW27913.1 helix-turn-helix transcriptional regulator [Lysobacter enzymogenes]